MKDETEETLMEESVIQIETEGEDSEITEKEEQEQDIGEQQQDEEVELIEEDEALAIPTADVTQERIKEREAHQLVKFFN